jgi:AcrR family transcriptional regulator
MNKSASKARAATEDTVGSGTKSRRYILDTAARLFRSEGYAATSLRDIAGACGMKAGSLYYHFDSKDEIVGEVLRIGVENVFREVRAAVAAVTENASAMVIIHAAVTAHLKALLELQDYTSANIRIFGQVPAPVREGQLKLRDEYEHFWASLFERCAQRGEIDPQKNLRLARLFLIGAMNGTLEWYHEGGVSLKALAKTLTEIFIQGLGPPVAPARPARQRNG